MAARRTKAPPDPRKLVGDVRVSTAEQALGPEALRAGCRANGATLLAGHEDIGVSGATPLGSGPD